MNHRPAAPLVVALTAGLALAVAACTSSAAPTGSPASGAPFVAAAPASAAVTGPSIASATPSPTAMAARSAMAGPIADGTYRTQPIPIATFLARIEADKTLSAAKKATMEQGFTGHTSDVIQLDLHGGRFTQSDAIDGAAFSVGAHATYAFPDDRTLVIQETCCGLSTFTVVPRPDGFTLEYKAGAPNAGEDVVGQAIYETAPFTLVP